MTHETLHFQKYRKHLATLAEIFKFQLVGSHGCGPRDTAPGLVVGNAGLFAAIKPQDNTLTAGGWTGRAFLDFFHADTHIAQSKDHMASSKFLAVDPQIAVFVHHAVGAKNAFEVNIGIGIITDPVGGLGGRFEGQTPVQHPKKEERNQKAGETKSLRSHHSIKFNTFIRTSTPQPMATALITGASEGIGLELARIHAAAQDDLILVARRIDLLHKLRDELVAAHQIQVHCYEMDLSIPANIDRLYQSTKAAGIQVHYLVNNAGFGSFGPFIENSWERDASMIDLNVRAVAHLTRLYARDMVDQGGGRILNVASTAAFLPGPGMAVYFATKAFVLHFSEALHLELRRHGITVTTLCPGPTQSGFGRAMMEPGSSAPSMFSSKRIPNSASVALFGYKAMMRGRAVAVHGWMNAVMAASTGFMPRAWVVRVSAGITGGLK